MIDLTVTWWANLPPEYMLDEAGFPILDEAGEPIIDEAWGGDEWILDGSALNELDTGGVLDGDRPVDLSDFVDPAGVSTTRGRNDVFTDVAAGTATVMLLDDDRRFDSTYAAGPYAGQLTAGKRVQVAVDGVVLLDGKVRSWRSDFRQNAATRVALTVEDGLATIGRRKFTEWTTTRQGPRARFVEVMQRNEVGYTGAVDFDEGVFTLQPDPVSYGSSVLNYLQLIARTDQGRLFASRDNVLTFRDRLSISGAVPVVTFHEDGSGVDIETITRTDDARSLFTRVTVDRGGGAAQTAVNADAETAFDGARALSITGLLLDSDTDSRALADYLVGIYSVPEQRIEKVTVNVLTVPAGLRSTLLGIELADVVGLVWTPQGVGPPLETVLVVESIAHQVGAFTHTMTLGFSTVENRFPWTLEDDLLGAVDGVAVLSF